MGYIEIFIYFLDKMLEFLFILIREVGKAEFLREAGEVEWEAASGQGGRPRLSVSIFCWLFSLYVQYVNPEVLNVKATFCPNTSIYTGTRVQL